MTSNVKRHVQLPRSSQKGKKPTADDLKYGEIAVNFNNEDPFLAIKGSDESIITMGFKNGETGPWKKGEGEYSAVLDNGTPISPIDKVNTATGKYATAEGKGNTASGVSSHAEGNSTTASAYYSHAEGTNTTASGVSSHAEGSLTTASGRNSHAEGNLTTASGYDSHAEGSTTKASGVSSHAEGSLTTASGRNSHAEGNLTTASGNNSHAEGWYSVASGDTSHAEGYSTSASGDGSHAEGNYTTVNGTNSHGEGNNKLFLILVKNIAVGDTTIIIDNKQMSIPDNEDYIKNCYINDNDDIYKVLTISSYTGTLPANFSGIAREITVDKPFKKASTNGTNDNTFTSDIYSFVNVSVGEIDAGHSEGKNNIVLGEAGHAEGKFTMVKGGTSHAEGCKTTAIGDYSHAEGYTTTAEGEKSHSEGERTTASGSYSHAEGSRSTASGTSSHAEGNNTTASGLNSHAEGQGTTANGTDSHTSGTYTTAENNSEFACGKYNKFNVNQIFSVGVGTTDNARKNALYITTDGVIGGDTQLTNGGTSMFGLKINGGIQASEGMISPTYLNSSDERLKKNIETISDDDIDKVKNVNLKSYVFKSDNSKHYGVIAQDVEKAGLSELVTNSSDGMKSVDYISLLILKISELENEIKNLKEQIKK